MSQPLFGVVVPGRHVITNFQPLTETKAISILEQPASITEITFFLLPGVVLPPGLGAILYYTIDQQAWELLGSISMEKPSGIFRTGWPTNDAVCKSSQVFIGVSLEPLETIQNLEIASSGYSDRFHFAHKIAMDLFQYMVSFSKPDPSGAVNTSQNMIVPVNIFDKWMDRFERKYRVDPNFMMKDHQ